MSYLHMCFSLNCIFLLFFSYLDLLYPNEIWHAVPYGTFKEMYKRIFDSSKNIFGMGSHFVAKQVFFVAQYILKIKMALILI